MIKDFVKKISCVLIRNSAIEPDEIDIYEYGLEVLICNLGITITILFMGLMMDVVIPTLIYLLLYCGLRIFTGGYHAREYATCFVISITTYSLVAVTCRLTTPLLMSELGLLLTLVSTIIIYRNSPVVDPKRPTTLLMVAKNKVLSDTILSFVLAMSLFLYIFELHFIINPIGYSLLAVAINIRFAVFQTFRLRLCYGGELNVQIETSDTQHCCSSCVDSGEHFC